jgi:hypothetical protein
LSQLAADLAARYGRAPEDAHLRFSGNAMKSRFVPGTVGWSLDYAEFINRFSFDGGLHSLPEEMEIPAL